LKNQPGIKEGRRLDEISEWRRRRCLGVMMMRRMIDEEEEEQR
jgi:hypothetical protein